MNVEKTQQNLNQKLNTGQLVENEKFHPNLMFARFRVALDLSILIQIDKAFIS